METLDVILILAFVPFLIRGLTKGFTAQVFSIAALILGAWLSFHFSVIISGYLQPYLDISNQLLNIISFVLIMTVTVIVMHLFGKILQRLLKMVMLKWLDSLLGLVFSLLCAVLTIGLILVLFESVNGNFNIVSDKVLSESTLYTPLKNTALKVFPYFKELLLK